MLLRGDAPAEKITVVHNGTGDPEASSPERIAALRVELGVGKNVMVFCAARLQKEKDIPTLIKAFAALRFNDQRSMSNDQKLGDDDAGDAAKNSEFRTLHSEGNEDAAPGSTGILPVDSHGNPGAPGHATKNESAALPKHSRFEVLDSNSLSSSAHPQILISDPCSLLIERGAALFIAGEGDQRAECERLIAALRFNDQRSMSNDQKLGDGDGFTTTTQRHEGRGNEVTGYGLQGTDEELGVRSEELEGGDGGNSEFRTLHSEGNEGATNNEQRTTNSAAEKLEVGRSKLEGSASRQVYPAGQNESAAHPNNLIIDHCSLVIEKDACGITLLGFRSDVSDLMSACDIFVLPAPAEPFGLVLIEAMALGKPVIAAAAGGPLEIVADGETGLLFEPGNAESLAQAINRLLENRELRQRMGEAGRKRYEEMFTAQQMAEKMLAAYAAASREPREVRS
ncbi:MAG: glycosyltransferase, partial [Phycisphaerae bacterium]